MIPLSVPNINGNEWKYVKDCLDTGWISSAGSYVQKFEEAIQNYTGATYAIACTNGTVGLQLSLQLAGVSAKDMVIAPNFTFVATLNAISYIGAEITLIDICEATWQIDVVLLEQWLQKNTITQIINNKPVTFDRVSGKRIAAILPVYVLGGFVAIDKLLALSLQYGIALVEDSTEALGSFKSGQHAGTYGITGVLSFNGNKIISSGGGGMILTHDKAIAEKAKHLITTAKTSPFTYHHDEIGYNHRMVNVLAAIGLGQMENFEAILKRKKEIAALYKKALKGIGDIQFQAQDPNSATNCWLFTFRTQKRDALIAYLKSKAIESKPIWMPMHQLPMYKNLKYIHTNDVSTKVFNTCISIPSSSNLSVEEQQKVITAIKQFFSQ